MAAVWDGRGLLGALCLSPPSALSAHLLVRLCGVVPRQVLSHASPRKGQEGWPELAEGVHRSRCGLSQLMGLRAIKRPASACVGRCVFVWAGMCACGGDACVNVCACATDRTPQC